MALVTERSQTVLVSCLLIGRGSRMLAIEFSLSKTSGLDLPPVLVRTAVRVRG